jgi:hypothetical protein
MNARRIDGQLGAVAPVEREAKSHGARPETNDDGRRGLGQDRAGDLQAEEIDFHFLADLDKRHRATSSGGRRESERTLWDGRADSGSGLRSEG